MIVWIADSFLLNLTTKLANEIPWQFRLIFFVVCILIALRLINGSHMLVLEGVDQNQPKVVTEDVYALMRHPMYFAYIVGFIALILLTMSLLSLLPLVIVISLLNTIATYEEKELSKILGQEYIDYMKRVPRWVPNPLKFIKK